MLLDGYIRVSQVRGRSGSRFISPAVQREQIETWASLNGATIGEVFEELDQSGARQDRPLLLAALERAESGASSGIIVARLDRFGRSLIDTLAAIERVHKAGARFISVQDGLDLDTPTGNLVLRIMLSMAEWELDRIRSNWEIARAKAVERGVFLGSHTPFGYQRDPDGRLKPHPENGPVLNELFRQRAQGTSLRTLGRSLEKRRIRTARGNSGWTETSLQHLFKNRVFLGEVRAGAKVNPDAHQPLVDKVTWQAAQNPRHLPSRRKRVPTLLGGLVRCGACSMALNSGTVPKASGHLAALYACHGRSAVGPCPSPASIAGGIIEPHVEQAFFSALSHQTRFRSKTTRRLDALKDKCEQAEASVVSYRDNYRLHSILGDERFEAGLEARLKARERAVMRLVAETRRIEAPVLPPAEEMEDQWPTLSIEQRRQAIAEVIDCVFVWRGRRNVLERTHICYRGSAPFELPRPGAFRTRTRSINRDELPEQPPLFPPHPWPKARMRTELEEFLDGRKRWPAASVFYREGRGPLYARIVRTGGPAHWARRVGADPPRGCTGLSEWNAADARATLAGLVRGRSRFLSAREFLEGGHGSLYGWLSRNGGLDYWASEFGVPRPRPGPVPTAKRSRA